MNNLKHALKQDSKKELRKFKEFLNEQETVKDILSQRYLNQHLTPSKRAKDWTKGALKAHLIERQNKVLNKRLTEQYNRIDLIEGTTRKVNRIDIVIEWRNNRTWGANPKAFATVYHNDNTIERFESSSIGGCGYDKQSTAIAQALNQSNEFLKMMYTEKNRPKNKNKTNREVFGYGSGYGILPSIEGGVGASCYYSIMEKLKMTFRQKQGTKSVDIFEIY